MISWAVGLVTSDNKVLVDSITAGSKAEALGLMIINHKVTFIKDWSIKGDYQEEVLDLLRQNKKIGAIKFIREKTGLGLKDAKTMVEEIERRQYG